MPILMIEGKKVNFESMPSDEEIDEVGSSIIKQGELKRNMQKAVDSPGFQYGKAIYEGLPFGKRIVSMIPGGKEVGELIEKAPEPTSIIGNVGKLAGQAVAAEPAIALAAGAGMAPLVAGAVGFGMQTAGQKHAEGATGTEALKEGALTTGATYLGGKALGLAGKAIFPNKGELAKEATGIYRDILRPTASEVKKIEVRRGGDINDYYNLAAEEGLKINKIGNKLDTSEAMETLKPKIQEIHSKLEDYLSSDTSKKFDLKSIASKAKSELNNTIKNASDLEFAKSEVDAQIKAEIKRHGLKVDAQTLNRIKQGLWSKSFNQLDIKSSESAKIANKMGHIAKETIENAFPDKNIKELNALSGKYQSLVTLLGNAHERVIEGGRLGNYFANTIGAVAGHGLGIPVVGEVGGAVLGGKISEAINDPLIASTIAASKAARSGIKGESFAKVMGEEIEKDPSIMEAVKQYAVKAGKQINEVVDEIKNGLSTFRDSASELGLTGQAGAKIEPKVEIPTKEAKNPFSSALTEEEKLLAQKQSTPARQENIRMWRNMPAVAGATAIGTGLSSTAEASTIPNDPEEMTKEFEGFKSKKYNDTKGVPTIGYGFNLKEKSVQRLLRNNGWTGGELKKETADKVFKVLHRRAKNDAKSWLGVSTYNKLTPEAQGIVTDMSYNLGGRLKGFTDFKKALESGDYKKASNEMINSNWYKQVGRRSKYLTEQMKKQGVKK